jgi:2-iminoacetate synthase
MIAADDGFPGVYRQHDFAGRKAWIASRTSADVRRALSVLGGARPAGARVPAAPGSATDGDLELLAALLSPAAAPFLEEMAQVSQRRTIERFGRTVQLYAPLYLSNVCGNVCTYCGFSATNRIPRKVLNDAEIVAEAEALRKLGFEHVLLVTGESGRVGRAYLAHALKLLRPYFASLSIEVQPLSEEDYRSLGGDGLSTVLVYQETYDPAAYARHHLSGPKSDPEFRLATPDRLGRAGIKKIGLGALYGLSDWRTDAWFAGLHLRYLEKQYWKTRYSLSFPRLRPHAGPALTAETPLALDPAPFGERELVQALCAFRLLSPEVELSLSTRESAAFRDRAFKLGFTSMSAGSRTNPGGYAVDPQTLEQFAIDDDRTPAAVAAMIRREGYEPVWKDWDPSYDAIAR